MRRISDKKGELVPALANKPKLNFEDSRLFAAFTMASGGRGGMGGPVLPSEIFATVDRFCAVEPNTDLWHEYVYLLRAMDSELLHSQEVKRKLQEKRKPTTARRPRKQIG